MCTGGIVYLQVHIHSKFIWMLWEWVNKDIDWELLTEC